MERPPQTYSECWRDQVNPEKLLDQLQKTTIRKQFYRGKSGTFWKLCTSNNASHRRVSCPKGTRKPTIHKVTSKPSGKRSYRQKESCRGKRTVRRKVAKKTVSRGNSTTTNRVSSRKPAAKQRCRIDFFTSTALILQRDSFWINF